MGFNVFGGGFTAPIVLAAFCLAGSPISPADASQGDFEGQIEVSYKKSGLPSMVTRYFVKPGKKRTDMPASRRGAVSVVRDHTADRKYIIDHAAKNYFVMPGSRKKSGSQPEKVDFSNIPTSGKKKTILGFECEQIIKKLANGTVLEVWFTTGLKPIEAIIDNRKMPASGLAGVPLLILDYRGGTLNSRWEVTRLERKKLADGVFTPPVDYKEIRMNPKDSPAGKKS